MLDIVPEQKIPIIASLSSDDKKLDFLQEIQTPSAKAQIIESLSSTARKRDLYKNLPKEFHRNSSVWTDAEKLKYLEEIDSTSYYASALVASLENDSNKINFLNSHHLDEEEQLKILCSLKNQQLKLQSLYELHKLSSQVSLLQSIPDGAQLEPIPTQPQNIAQQILNALGNENYIKVQQLLELLPPWERDD